jgi:hypothetical protein
MEDIQQELYFTPALPCMLMAAQSVPRPLLPPSSAQMTHVAACGVRSALRHPCEGEGSP